MFVKLLESKHDHCNERNTFNKMLHYAFKIISNFPQTHNCSRNNSLFIDPDYEFAFGAGMGGGAGGGRGGEHGAGTASGSSHTVLKQVDRVRSVFPETWLWSNTTTG